MAVAHQLALWVGAVVMAWLGTSAGFHTVRVLPDHSLHARRRLRLWAGLVSGTGLWLALWAIEWALLPQGPSASWSAALGTLGWLVLLSAGWITVLERHFMGTRRLSGHEGACLGPGCVLALIVATGAMRFPGLWQVPPSTAAALTALGVGCAWLASACFAAVCAPGWRKKVSWWPGTGLGLALAAGSAGFLRWVPPWPAGDALTRMGTVDVAHWPMLVGWVGLLGLILPLAAMVLEQQGVQRALEQLGELMEINGLLEQRTQELGADLQWAQRQADQKRSTMMETAAVNFFEVQTDTGTIAFAERCLYLGGDRRHELSAREYPLDQWHLQVHPDDVVDTTRRLQDCLEGTTEHFEAPYRLKLGGADWRWVMARARVVEWTSERHARCLYGTLIDVHEDRCRQLALDEERQMLTTGPVVMVRVAEVKGALRLTYVSDNVGKLWGLDGAALMSLGSWLSMVHHDDVEQVRGLFARALAHTQPTGVDVEVRLRLAEGPWRWFRYSTLVNPDALEHRGYFIDIDARKQAELEAATQRQRLQEMVLQLEAAQDEGGVLQDTSDMLHATERMQEAFDIIRLAAVRLFPGWSGQVAAAREGGSDLVIGAQWGQMLLSPQGHFEGSDCWGIRRGKAHSFFNAQISICCPHMRHVPASEMRPHMCVPMAAHGETVGSLNLWCHADRIDEAQMQQVQRRASRFAETLKLALSNLKLRASLQTQAMTDSLTGLHNRRHLDTSLLNELQRAGRTRQVLSLAMIDVDHFKRFNDRFGHDAGDTVLRGIAAVLQENTRGYDLACRYGGEEMAVIMPGCNLQDAMVRIEQIRLSVSQLQLRHGGTPLPPVTISAGVAEAWGGDPQLLIRRADEALYEAKVGGRDRIVLARPAVPTTVMGELASTRAALL